MKTYKKFKEIPLTNPSFQDMYYASYDAPEPRCIGHKIFIPKEDATSFINTTFHCAYKYGTTMVDMKRWKGFKLVMEHGGIKGQIFGWPHFHLIPIANETKVDD